MRRLQIWPGLLTLALLLGCAGSGEGTVDGEEQAKDREFSVEVEQEMPAVVEGNNRFALDLYKGLASQRGNLFLSPFSLSTALAMTSAGAAGRTAEEMEKVLRLPTGDASAHSVFSVLLERLEKGAAGKGYRLAVANRLWGQSGYSFLEDFLAVCSEHYGSGFEQLDFANDPEKGRQVVNRWVESETAGLIEDLLPPGGVTALTRLILTNAVYFKGLWSSQFDSRATAESPFYVAPDRTVSVPLMRQEESFGYAELDGLKILELGYQGEDLAMVILLPDQVDGLPELEKQLSYEGLTGWVGSLSRRKVEVYVPRFEMTAQFSLSEALKRMGLQAAFVAPRPSDPETADFTRMTKERELFLQEVFHKAFVQVNEEGTEAAAGTGITIGVTSLPVDQPVFRADHPFLFVIRDRPTDSILFMGRVVDPQG